MRQVELLDLLLKALYEVPDKRGDLIQLLKNKGVTITLEDAYRLGRRLLDAGYVRYDPSKDSVYVSMKSEGIEFVEGDSFTHENQSVTAVDYNPSNSPNTSSTGLTTASEKNSVLRVVYESYKKYGSDDDRYAEYFASIKESGLNESTFAVALEELIGDKLLFLNGAYEEFTFIEITHKGVYLFERGGFTELKEQQYNNNQNQKSQGQVVLFQKANGNNPLAYLHPTVQKNANDLFQNGHFRQAILDTYIDLVDEIRKKSASSLDGSTLMTTVFSAKNPILSVSDNADEQLGFMWLFAGAVMGIRNPRAHQVINQPDPQRALEWLFFASALFRILDESKLPTVTLVQQP